MSTEAEFDLIAFCSAVKRCDAATQLRFYAREAQVRLTSLQDPAKFVRMLEGGAVEHWINDRCANREVTYTVDYHWLEHDKLMMTEECRSPDGTSAFSASTAKVVDGLIASQSVVLISLG